MKLSRSHILITAGILALALLLAGTVMAQDTGWCVSPDGVTPVGCAEITIAPAGTVGDFYLGDTPMATAQNPGRLVLPVGTHTINVRNIVSAEEGFGTLFVYNDATTSVTTTAGNVTARTVTATKKFIRGTLALTCDIKSATATDVVMCAVTIDGVPQPDLLTPGMVKNYILDPGAHTVNVAVVGDAAIYWSPASRDHSANVTAGRTAPVKSTFNKSGHLIATVSEPNTVGDWYINGVLIASQVASIDQWVEPAKNHKLEVKALTDSTANGLYYWKDATATAYLTAGSTKNQTVKLTKVWLKGFVDLTCDIKAATAADQIGCLVTIDGVAQPEIVAPGTVKQYVLDPGAHTINAALNGASSIYWAPASREQKVTVRAGRTTAYKPAFLKAGHLMANLSAPGTVGDWYVDGVLVATQAPTIDVWLEPSKSHKVEVKAVTDPAANGQWYWKDATQSVFLSPAQEKTQTVKLTQVWLVGFIELTCNITNFQPGMSCLPVLDGVNQPLVPAGGIATYTVPTGAHKLVVSIDPASEWGSTPKTFNANVLGGKTFKANATLTAVIPKFDITLVNNSFTAVCNVFISLTSNPEWGADKLTAQIAPGASRTFTVEKGTYDLYAQNCKSNPLDVQYNVTVNAPMSWVVNGPLVFPGAPTVTLTVDNQTSIEWCYAFFMPTGADSDFNWLGPDQAITGDSSRQFLTTTGVWDLFMVDCTGTWIAWSLFTPIVSNYTWTVAWDAYMVPLSEFTLPSSFTLPELNPK